MPYYAWKGVNLKAQVCTGKQFANDIIELDINLLKKEIALLSCVAKKILIPRPIHSQAIINYCLQLTMLLKAGILLPEALKLVADQTPNPSFAYIAHDVSQKVNQGISLSVAFSNTKKVFNDLIIQMVAAGHEAGSLPAALEVLTLHLESLALFKNRLRAAFILPAITFGFFIVIIAIMLLVVVPQFAALFISLHKDIPRSTQILITISCIVRKWYGVMVVGTTFLMYGFFLLKKTSQGKKWFESVCINTPLLKTIITNITMTGFFQSVAFLLEGGIPLVKALYLSKELIGNSRIKNKIDIIADEVNAGNSFANALYASQLCDQEVISLITIGQESGKLQEMLKQVASSYQYRLLRVLGRINNLFGPCLLLILGLLIAALIFALYTPILNLSYIV